MFSIRTNVASLGAQRNMTGTNSALNKSMEKLSSGFRINRAGDDAAGLAISEKLKGQVSGLNQAARNSMDGISMIQTAEAGLDEVQSIMQRMRELAVQGANDTLGTDEREAINNELQELKAEVQNISRRTTFNNQGLLRGSLEGELVDPADDTAALTLAISADEGTITAGSGTAKFDVSGATGSVAGRQYTFSAETEAVEGDTNNGITVSVTVVDETTGDSQTVKYLASEVDAADESKTLNFTDFGIKIVLDGDVGTAASDFTGTLEVTGTNSAVLQTGANSGDETDINFLDTRLIGNTQDELLQLKEALEAFDTDKTRDNAVDLIEKADAALTFISKERAKLGAAQNRLEHTIANAKAASENLAASNSRIRDVDVAQESAEMARGNILLQAGVSVLAQANQLTQLSLKLLG